MGAGRPTDYREEYNEQAEKLCKLGFTDQELAEFFEVHVDTIYEWKSRHSKFSEAVKRGKDIADAEVAHSLHKRAVGYKYDEITYEKIDARKDGMEVDDSGDIEETKTEVFKRRIVVKEVAPDAGAAMNWLKNRQPKKWRDKNELDLRTPDGLTINHNNLTDEELMKLAELQRKAIEK